MNTVTPSSETDPLVELAEEYAERFRRGERPALTEYTDKYPDLADRIRKLFPALVVMEEFGSVAGPSTEPHSTTGASAPPRQLGDYRILREVGRGGMGVVYEAVQESLGRHVALKVLPAQNWKNSTHLERFRREARAVARLHHTNIVPVFDRGEAEGTHYYAMQFIQGQSLDCVLHELKRLRRVRSARPGDSTEDPPTGMGHRHSLSASIATGLIFGRFPDASESPDVAGVRANPPTDARTTPPVTSWGGEGRSNCRAETAKTDAGNRSELTGHSEDQYFRGVARIGVQAAEALAYAHQQGILHRDVKPSNLLLDTQGTIWVTDFGLAKAEDSEELTSAGDIVGTIRYMAPERFKGHADPRSDVYALGLTLYEMLTLKPAYDSTDRARMMDRITRESPPAPRKIDPRIPRDFETVVLKAIAREPAERYASAAALADDLQRFLADRPIRAQRTSWAGHTWRWCRRNPVVAGLLTTVAALLVVTVVVLAVSNARIGRALEQEIEAKNKAEQTLYYQWVAQAADARDKNRAARAEEFLDRCPSRLRGWEWHYLKRLPFATFPGVDLGDELILRVAFNADGGLLAVGTVEGRVSVWNARTGTPVLASFQAQKEMIRGTAFSPDNQYLATGGRDDRVKLWELRTGEPKREFPLEGPAVLLTLKFSPDGRQLAASDQDQKIWVWDVETGARTRLDSPDRLAIHGLEFSADSQQLLAVSTEGVVTSWDVTAHSATRVFDAEFPGIHVVAFSPDRRLIALGNEHGTVRVIQTEPWQRAWDLEAHTTSIQALAFGSGGDRLASSASSDMTVRFWDMRTGQEALSADFVGSRENALAFSPDGHRLATGSTKGIVRILDGTPVEGAVDGGQVLTLEGHTHAVGWLSYSPNGERIASASSNGTIKVWHARSGEKLWTLPAGDSALTGVAFSSDGRRLVASSWDGAVRIWNVDTGREIYAPLRAQAGPVYGVTFSRDDRAFASAHHDGTLRVWDADTGEPRQVIRAHPHPVLGLAFSPDGEFLASTGGKDHCARIWKWDADTQAPVLTLTGQRGILRNPVYSPDGRRVAALISGMRHVCLWDVSPGGGTEREETRLVIPGAGGLISLVVFHPDGRRLIVVSDDQLQLLDPDTGVVQPLPAAHAGDIRCAALSPDGKFLATGAGYRGRGEVRIWDASKWEKP